MEPYYRPWLGEAYAASRLAKQQLALNLGKAPVEPGDGLDIHVMGISHYGDPGEHEPGETIRIVTECAFAPDRAKNSQFFTRVANVVSDALWIEKTEDYRRQLWGRLAYSNFVQQIMPKSRRSPMASDWEEGRSVFMDQLRITTPSILFTLGWQVWQNLPEQEMVKLGTIEPLSSEGEAIPDARAYVYLSHGVAYSTLVVPTAHPSSGGHFDAQSAAKRLRTGWMVRCGVVNCEIVQDRMSELLESTRSTDRP